MDHIELVHNVNAAVTEVFSDTSVSKKDIIESLKEISEDIESLIITLEEEI